MNCLKPQSHRPRDGLVVWSLRKNMYSSAGWSVVAGCCQMKLVSEGTGTTHTCLWLLWLIVWIVSQQKSFQCCNCLKFIKVWWVVFANKLVSSMQTTGSHCSLLVSKAITGKFSLRQYTTSKLQEPHTSQSGKTSCSLLSSLTLVNLNC